METFGDNEGKNPEGAAEKSGKAKSDNGPSYATLEPGFVVANRYIIQAALGSGSMGSVYRALDQEINGSHVAVKILHRKFASKKHLKRFMKEARLMHQISHENVVRTYAFGTDGDLVFYTMEYLEGRSLAELIDSREISVDEVSDLAIQICRGLEAIHMSGVIHRDLKPSNILVSSDRQVKIMDFGIARSEDSNITAHGEILGSAGYMSPEIWLGQSHTPSVDIYALGIILYEVVCGELPFSSTSPAALMRHHLDTEPIPPKEKNPEVPAWLSDLILVLLRKAPEERPKSVRHVINQITRVNEGGPADATREESKSTKTTGYSLGITIVSAVLAAAATFLVTRSFTPVIIKEVPAVVQAVPEDSTLKADLEKALQDLAQAKANIAKLGEEKGDLGKKLKEARALNLVSASNNKPNVALQTKKKAAKLVTQLSSPEKIVRAQASKELLAIGPIAEPIIAKGLEQGRAELLSMELLGKMKSSAGLGPMIVALGGSDADKARTAKRALRKIGSPLALEAISQQEARSKQQQKIVTETESRVRKELEQRAKDTVGDKKQNVDRIIQERKRKVRQAVKRGNDLYWRERYSDAVREFNLAVSLSPDNWEAQSGLGYALQAIGENEKAIGHLKRAVQLNPKDSDAQEVLRLLEELVSKRNR